jgi:hypothetical protein
MRCRFHALSEDRKHRGRFLRFEHELMSILFRSATDRASVAVEESHDGGIGWGRVGMLEHRPGRC